MQRIPTVDCPEGIRKKASGFISNHLNPLQPSGRVVKQFDVVAEQLQGNSWVGRF